MRIEARLETRPQGDRRAAPRRELHLRLTSLTGRRATANVLVLDLSQTGLLLQTSTRLTPGETLQINLPHAGFRAAEVVWTSGEFVGCRFAEPISSAAISAAQLRSEASGAVGAVSRAAIDSSSPEGDSFGARLRRLREQYNLSQAALAKLLDVTKLSIWKWERGDAHPRQARIAALASLFAVSENELLAGTPAASPLAEADSGEPERLAEIIDECKARIADHLGTTADKVEITVSL
ncbi:MAG: helix-turn-helix domain-containing protein [Porphyrobacter sp.]|nr:helix-turn-helix domain-containing protein [Porphyrobacter sp.]